MPVGKTWSEGDASTHVFDELEAAVDDDEIGADVDVDGDRTAVMILVLEYY